MLKNTGKPKYTIEHRHGAPSVCLPSDYETYDLLEVSAVGDQWATFMNITTGYTISCSDFYNRMLQEMENECR